MKVYYVITKANWGGAQRYVYDLATNLPKDKFVPIIVCGGNGTLVDKAEAAEIQVIKLPGLGRDVNVWNDFLVFLALIKLFKKEKPAIIHLNSSKIGGLGSLAGRIARVPKIIFTAHGWAFNEARPKWQKKVIAFLHWLTIRFSHRVITVAQIEAEQVATWPKIRGKIKTIYNGISPLPFLYRDTAREQLLARYPSLMPYRNQFWIGTIGELHQNKDFVNAIGAIALLKRQYPEVRYLIIGEGEQKSKLESLITEFELEKNVFLLGPIPDAPKYLKAFDLFLLNSRKEGLPYVILEAGLAGLPVVATRVGGIPEIITKDQTGVLVPPEEAEATAEAIEALMSNGLEREILGRNLETFVRNNFSLEQMVEKTVALYNEE